MLRFVSVLAALLTLVGCADLARLSVGVDEIGPQELAGWLGEPEPPVVVDVRESSAYEAGHIGGAISLRRDDLYGYFL